MGDDALFLYGERRVASPDRSDSRQGQKLLRGDGVRRRPLYLLWSTENKVQAECIHSMAGIRFLVLKLRFMTVDKLNQIENGYA